MNAEASRALANEIRKVRVALRAEARAVKDQRESRALIADALAAEPTALAGLMVWDLLGWCWHMTDTERLYVLTAADVPDPYALVRELSADQIDKARVALLNGKRAS